MIMKIEAVEAVRWMRKKKISIAVVIDDIFIFQFQTAVIPEFIIGSYI